MTWTSAGSLKGPAGVDGAPGTPGAAGRGISTAQVQPDGTLLLTFSDNTTQNVGLVKGLDGTNGTNGTNGVDGKDGKSVTISGSVADAAALPSNLGAGDAGMGYITEDDGHLHVWGGSTFTDVGTVRGPAGPAGANGTNGTDGAAGQTGATGQRGTAWYTGHGAPAATVSPGQLPGDLYLDLDSGLVYVLS